MHKSEKKKFEAQFSVNQTLKDEIGKKINFLKEHKKRSKSTHVDILNM